MKLENQVTSIQISRILHEKGITYKTKYVWVFYAMAKKWELKEKKEKQFIPGAIPAFTLSELGEMFPFGNFSMNPVIKISNGLWTVHKNDKEIISFETEVDARAFYLFTMVKNGEIQTEQINTIIVKSKLVASGQETPDPNDDKISTKTIVDS